MVVISISIIYFDVLMYESYNKYIQGGPKKTVPLDYALCTVSVYVLILQSSVHSNTDTDRTIN